MTKLRLLALLAVVALVLFPAMAFSQGGAPQLPCAFHGTVQVNGQNVADGTVITAMIGNATYTTTTPSAAGASTYKIVIAQPAGTNYDGMTVTFKIGNATASQTGTWQMGGNVALNLTKGVPITPGGQGGGITQVVVNALPAGSAPTVSYNSDTGVLTLGIPAGATGATGATGAIGPQGPTGKSASNVYGIVGIALAVIAIIIAVVVMMRKPQAPPAPPAQKT
jgi:hypothetical protein